MEGILSELNYFEPLTSQLSITEEYTQSYPPSNALSHGAPIEFNIKGSEGNYIDLNNSYLHLIVKITGPLGQNLDANAVRVGPINDPLNSMFASIELKLQNEELCDITTKYHYKAYIENLINYTKLIMETRMLTQVWMKDTAGEHAIVDPRGNNLGLRQRAAVFAGSRDVHLIGRPHLDLFHQDKLIPSKIDIQLRLIPNMDSYVLKSAAPGDGQDQIQYKLIIQDAHLCLRHKKLAPSLSLGLERILQSKNYVINYKKVTTKTLTIAQGHQNLTIQSAFTGRVPDLVVLGMVVDTDNTAGYQRSPFNFQHFNLAEMYMEYNGEIFPRQRYIVNFTERDYIKAYFTTLEALGYDTGVTCWNLTPHEWANGFTIFVFKLSPGPTGSLQFPSRSGGVDLHMRFRQPLPSNVNIILLSETPSELQIDKNHTVINII